MIQSNVMTKTKKHHSQHILYLTAPEWPGSVEVRAWESNFQGVEAPRPLLFAQKDTRTGMKLQKTPRDCAEHGEGLIYYHLVLVILSFNHVIWWHHRDITLGSIYNH